MKVNNNLLVNPKKFSYLKYFRILEVFRTSMKDVESEELRILVSRAIEIYNRYRSPEATATLLEFGANRFTIEFEGTFCHTCGVQDYLDDFLYELEDLDPNMKVEIMDTTQTNLQSYRVTYKVKDPFSQSKPDDRTLFREFLNERGLSIEHYTALNPCTKDVIISQFSQWLYEGKQRSQILELRKRKSEN